MVILSSNLMYPEVVPVAPSYRKRKRAQLKEMPKLSNEKQAMLVHLIRETLADRKNS